MARSHKGFAHLCEQCRGVRLHTIEIRRGGLITRRMLVCSACSAEKKLPHTEQPGICCPACGDCRLRTKFTRHRQPGVTTRVRQCLSCSHRIRTKEVLDSLAV
jgi:hypothetical protein